MMIKRYADVKPGTYAGIPDGVQMREMITAEDGAPNFTLRVFDVEASASTPYHSHAWEHEVYILQGTGRDGSRPRGVRRRFRPGIQSTSRRTRRTVLSPMPPRGSFAWCLPRNASCSAVGH